MILRNHRLSEKTGIPVHTIRYYEKYGLFKGEKNNRMTTNNNTWHVKAIIEKLELITEAKSIGYTLPEIKSLIDARYS